MLETHIFISKNVILKGVVLSNIKYIIWNILNEKIKEEKESIQIKCIAQKEYEITQVFYNVYSNQ